MRVRQPGSVRTALEAPAPSVGTLPRRRGGPSRERLAWLIEHRAQILTLIAVCAIAAGGLLHLAGEGRTAQAVWRAAVALLAAELSFEVARSIAIERSLGANRFSIAETSSSTVRTGLRRRAQPNGRARRARALHPWESPAAAQHRRRSPRVVVLRGCRGRTRYRLKGVRTGARAARCPGPPTHATRARPPIRRGARRRAAGDAPSSRGPVRASERRAPRAPRGMSGS